MREERQQMASKERDRLCHASVAASFGDTKALERLGSASVRLECPQCQAVGERHGNPGEDMRFDGFTPLTAGGMGFILAKCHQCQAEVTLPHRKVAPNRS